MAIINGKKYTTFREVHERNMKDPEFRKAYEALKPRREYISKLIDLRNEGKITQKELAKAMGMHQSAIARFESGTSNPSFEFVRKIAAALGRRIEIVK